MPGRLRTRTMLIPLAGLAALLAGAPGAAAAPGSVAVLGGTLESGSSRLLVVAERRPGGRLRVSALRADREPGAGRVPLYLMQGGCGSQGKRLGKLEIPDGRVVTRSYDQTMPIWLHVPAYNPKEVGVEKARACTRLGRPAGVIVYRKLTDSEQFQALVAVQRRGERTRVTALLAGQLPRGHVLGATTRSCSQPMSATDLDWQIPAIAGRPSITAQDDWEAPDIGSLAVLPGKGAVRASPVSCERVKWELSELDA
jgi:hypothetical protein